MVVTPWWFVLGTEKFRFTKDGLICESWVWPFRRKKVFEYDQIKDLEPNDGAVLPYFDATIRCKNLGDFGNPYFMGTQVDEEEAPALVHFIQQRIDEASKNKESNSGTSPVAQNRE